MGVLSLEQWLQTLADFNWMCAYCKACKFQVLEHFLPVNIAGTTAKNCIPACYNCNSIKRDRTGYALYPLFGKEVIEYIAEYLEKRSLEEEKCLVNQDTSAREAMFD